MPISPPTKAEDLESELIADFIFQFGMLLFANLKRGRAKTAV